jgi:hypothetical protein
MDDRIALALQIVLGRDPTDSELTALSALWTRRREEFQADPASAATFVNSGSVPLPASTDASEAAAWTLVASVLLNLDETLTRE